jgi:SprT-like family
VIITIQSSPKTYGHFTASPVWKAEEESYHDINHSAEHLDRAFENIEATIAHEMCHLYAKIKRIADTSKDGRYHNKNFRHRRKSWDSCGVCKIHWLFQRHHHPNN